MLPDKSPIVKCAKCRQLFWTVKAKELASIDWLSAANQDSERFANAPAVLDPTEQDLLDFSKARDLSQDEQLTVRRRALWLANDRFRHGQESTKAEFSQAQLGNMRSLYSLLKDEDPGERILKAEIARELGNFGDCLQLLNKEFQGAGQAARAKFIRELAAKKNIRVMQLPRE